MTWPRHVLYYGFNADAAVFRGYGLRSNPIGRNLEETLHMTYSQVTENTLGNGKTVTKFRDFISNGNDYDYNWDYTNASNSSYDFYPENGDNLAKGYFAYLLNDRSIERGKPDWIKVYDVSNNIDPIEETIFTYNDDLNRFNQYSAKLHLSGPFVQANKLYYYSDFLTEKTHRQHLENGTLTTITSNTYDDNLKKVVSSTTTFPDNSTVKTENIYQHISAINLILMDESWSYRNGEITSKQNIEYGDETDPDTDYKYYPIEVSNYKYISGQSTSQMEAGANKVFVHRYDSNGNPLWVSKLDGAHTSYIWGYGGSLLIAKIENIHYDQIPQATIDNLYTLSNLDTGLYNNISAEDNLRQALDDLRNSLLGSMVTTYTHNPLTGVTSVTDHRGDTQYYHFDSHERLSKVEDKDGNRLSKQEYNFKPQN